VNNNYKIIRYSGYTCSDKYCIAFLQISTPTSWWWRCHVPGPELG